MFGFYVHSHGHGHGHGHGQKIVGGGPTASHFIIRFAHPTGRPSGAQQTTLSTAKKVTKKAANRRRRLIATGASRSVFCPAVPEGSSPSGIGGTFTSAAFKLFL